MENKRAKMDRAARAKQFMPFDALKGFREALEEKERILVPRRDLSEEKKEEIDRIVRSVCKNDWIEADYFVNETYARITGIVSEINETERFIEVFDTRINFDDISELQTDKCN